MDSAKVALQRGNVSLTVEGTEAFVKEVLGMWESLAGASPVPDAADSIDKGSAGLNNGQPPLAVSQFENVYDKVDGKLKIIAHVPGNTKADKTRNTALILLYGHYLEGAEQIPSEAIREASTDQGCFDSANFASHLKALKEKLAMNTKAGGGYDIKLTAPGRKAAKELVEALNN